MPAAENPEEKKKVYKVRKICSVCGKGLGEMESAIDMPSHGLCPECAKIEREKMLEAVRKSMEK
ncbi:MAG: hypothetical protein P4L58_04210 [Candidatus Pacebacteria bacterium]|nr:hypothetical protein [Candidatus Paceibacterota bacterium]